MQYFSVGLQYGVYSLEAGLLALLLLRYRVGRSLSLFLYLSLLLTVDAVSRPYVLYRYGYSSQTFGYFYWLTDVLLTLGAFFLVFAFFRRACVNERKMWQSVRLLLVLVFVLTLGISLITLSRNYDQLLTRFIFEFQQNLYFTCLVLNTLLYILMQKLESTDDELTLLVCGMGIQFAGPAANFALVHLTPGQGLYGLLYPYVRPLCTLGMLLTWFYALVRGPQPSAVRTGPMRVGELAPVVSREV